MLNGSQNGRFLSQKEVAWGHHARQGDRATQGSKKTQDSKVARWHRATGHDRATLIPHV